MDEEKNIIIYRTADGKASVALYAKDGKIWLNQQQMGELFATSKLHNTKRKQLDAQIADAEDIKMLEDWRKAL